MEAHPNGGFIIDVTLVGSTFKGARLYAPGLYGNGRLALSMETAEGEPLTTVTVNMPDHDLDEGHVFVKNYAENEGLVEQLTEVLKPVGREVKSLWASIPEMELVVPVESLKGV